MAFLKRPVSGFVATSICLSPQNACILYPPFSRASRLSRARHHPYATQAETPKKPYYVTTPIFYVNAAPHVGHLYSMLLADTLKRWQILQGNTDAKFLTGTDEHGMKIQQAAQKAGMDTQAFCDMNCKTFKDLAKASKVSNDQFIRTTDEAHKDAVRYFWEMLQHRGYIYSTKHEGWYSVSDEAFYPQSQVQPSLDPATGRKLMTSIETGKEVEWSAETNYHFRLSAFKDRLLQFYRDSPNFIRPKAYEEALIKSIEDGLQDLSISRPVERLTWGVRVPGDESQTIYVWLDALVNYLTAAGYPFTPGKERELSWPADVHVVGKDITRFHCVFWPAFLMALDLPLPRQVMVHGHWTMNKKKMSKSTGNVVNPFFAIDRFGVDTMRFFLLLNGPAGADADYDNDFIARDYKKYLQNGIGNIAHRIMGVTKGQLRPCLEAAASGTLPPPTTVDEEFEEQIRKLKSRVAQDMDHMLLKSSLKKITACALLTQSYVHRTEPWQYKTDPSKGYRIVYNVLESIRIMGILLQPFMPEKSTEMLDYIGVQPGASARGFVAADFGADFDYGHVEQKKRLLFPPLLIED